MHRLAWLHARGCHLPAAAPSVQPLAGEVAARGGGFQTTNSSLWYQGTIEIVCLCTQSLSEREVTKYWWQLQFPPSFKFPLAARIVQARVSVFLVCRLCLALLAYMLHFLRQWISFPYSCFTSSFWQSSEKATALTYSAPLFAARHFFSCAASLLPSLPPLKSHSRSLVCLLS